MSSINSLEFSGNTFLKLLCYVDDSLCIQVAETGVGYHTIFTNAVVPFHVEIVVISSYWPFTICIF